MIVPHVDRLVVDLESAGMNKWAALLPEQLQTIYSNRQHGDIQRWQTAIESLPDIAATNIDFSTNAITVTSSHGIQEDRERLKAALLDLSPWRKGPYQLHGVDIDSEWRSDLKWERIQKHLGNLSDQMILDVGCGNGYYAWRMLGDQAKLVIGIDPNWLFMHQFAAILHYTGRQWPVHLLPMGIDELPFRLLQFDKVFSMGVLYHRRSPIDHLLQLKECLKPAGELVLETLIIDGLEGESLVPRDRYAKMRNVWFLPSITTLQCWLNRVGFQHTQVVDVSVTTRHEQRQTEWMQFESLNDFLDPEDPTKTVEGYPAPMRVVISARR